MIQPEKIKLQLVDFLRKTEAVRLLDDYRESQWWSYDQIWQTQLARIRALIMHTYTNVPFYREKLDSLSIKPANIMTLDDFRKLPLLDKQTIRENGKNMLAHNRRQFQPHPKATGGSTGEPLQYYMDRKSRSAQWAHIYRLWCNAGWRPGERMVMLGGTSLYPSAYAVKKWFYVKLNNWLLLSAFGMSDAHMQKWIKQLRRFKAQYLHAYASGAYLLAKFIEERNISDIKFNAVFTTAELLHPKYRKTIERVFRCKVYDFYGAADGGAFAFECEQQKGLHCVSESCFIEVVKSDGKPAAPGEIGEIVTTDLNNYAMPFIRYKVGDQGAFAESACDCGRGLPRLQTVVGRTPDFIESKTGERYHEEFFSYLFKEIDWVCQFCVVQENRDALQIYFKPDRPPQQSALDHLHSFLSKKFKNMNLKLQVTQDLPVSPNGKFKYIINKCKP